MKCLGHVIGNASIYEILNLNKPLARAPTIFTVFWCSPIISWIKIDTDGLTKGNLGDSSCTAICRGFNGILKGCFALGLGHHSAFFIKLYAIILVINGAFTNGWRREWLESDFLWRFCASLIKILILLDLFTIYG